MCIYLYSSINLPYVRTFQERCKKRKLHAFCTHTVSVFVCVYIIRKWASSGFDDDEEDLT